MEQGSHEEFSDNAAHDSKVSPKAFIVSLVVRNPCTIFLTILIPCIGITCALYFMVLSGAGNPFSPLGKEMDVGDIRSIHYNSLRLARQEVENTVAASGTSSPIQSEIVESTYWAFESDSNGGLFGDPSSIHRMKDAFDIFLEDVDFANYCLLDSNQECERPLSPLRMYFASSWDSEKVQSVIDDFKDPQKVDKFNALGWCYVIGINCEGAPQNVPKRDIDWVNNLYAEVIDIMNSWDMRGELIEEYKQATEFASYLLETDIFKSAVEFGYDKDFSSDNQVSKFSRGILNWGSPLDTPSNQTVKDQLKSIIKDKYLEEMDRATKDQSYYFMSNLIDDAILKIILKDSKFALLSMAFIFLWIRRVTRSWFLATVGFFEILFSITLSWFIFKVVLRFDFFPPQNALAFFIVAAIGADDIFIFMDAYNESKYESNILADMETRMTWVFQRTATSMLSTSATTIIAFILSAFTSPLPSVKSFGIFTAMVVLLDYLLVISLFFTSVVIYHDRFEDSSAFGCCFPCGKLKLTSTERAKNFVVQWGRPNSMTSFFEKKVAPAVQKICVQLLLIGGIITWIAFALQYAIRIGATQQAEQVLNDAHPIQKSFTILNTAFPTANDDVRLKIYYAWGVDEVNQDGVNLLRDPTYYGKARFVDSFEFNKQCQTQLASFCYALRTNSEYDGLIKRRNGVGDLNCFVEEFAAYSILGNLNDCDYVRSGLWRTENWQVAPADLPRIMEGFLKENSCFDESGRYSMVESVYASELGWDGSSMRYAAISARTEILTPFGIFPESVTRKEYEKFAMIADSLGKQVSEFCYGDVIMTDLDRKFVFMNNQAIYAKAALNNSLLGIAIAFGAILLKTYVFHLAMFTSITIACVLISVVGIMVVLGWELGTMESILVGILSGFSVDYIIHLAQEYKSSEGETEKRVRETFRKLGSSLLNGMLTSVFASLPLICLCQLQFFVKFGIFFVLTIMFAWFFANFFFMTMLASCKFKVQEAKMKVLLVQSFIFLIGIIFLVKELRSWARRM